MNTSTDIIWLNAKELLIHDATATLEDASVVNLTQVRHDTKLDRVALQAPSPICGSKTRVSIGFSGTINNALAGFYHTSVQNPTTTSAEGRHVFSTQFESCEARRAFPCFDEPSLKATFDFTIEIPKHLTALSNMPEKEVTRGATMRTIKFERTPRMSTYVCILYLIRAPH